MITTYLRRKYDPLPDIGLQGTILFSGISGSGKTYSMKEVLDRSIFKYPVGLSCIEIYEEKIYDLCSDKIKFPIKQGAEKIHDLYSKETLNEYLKKIVGLRQTKSTKNNPESSRSHMVLKIGKLVLVDLSGNESLENSESIGINKSLFALNRVILCLENGYDHIPYRESVLTKVLQYHFQHRKITFIGCLSNPEVKKDKLTTEFINRLKTVTLIQTLEKEDENGDVETKSISTVDIRYKILYENQRILIEKLTQL